MPSPNTPPRASESAGGPGAYLSRWTPSDCAELFAFFNLAFLALDIYLAHSYNRFAQAAEWVPLAFSIVAPIVLLISYAAGGLAPPRDRAPFWRTTGLIVGWCSIAVGVAGLLFHLNSQFFESQTIKNLVYTAPFAAPLAYAGLGLLLILNRMASADSPEWAHWVILLALGGFFGNFVLSLADHAANGFYDKAEWVPVIASALAGGFLLVPLTMRVGPAFIRLSFAIMFLQIAVGLLGFFYHVRANLHGPSTSLWSNFVHGAPAFAPLLFANLAMLAGIGLWALQRTAASSSTDRPSLSDLLAGASGPSPHRDLDRDGPVSGELL